MNESIRQIVSDGFVRSVAIIRNIWASFLRFLRDNDRLVEILLIALTLLTSVLIARDSRADANRQIQASIETARMSRADSYAQMQASILNDFKAEFESLRPARLVASDFALKHLDDPRGRRLPFKEIPPEVWQLMDFFDNISMYTKRNYIDKEMTFVGFYYWMGPYYKFYQEEMRDFKSDNPLAMYDEIPTQMKILKLAGMALGKTEYDFRRALADEKIREFFELECKESRPPPSSSTPAKAGFGRCQGGSWHVAGTAGTT
jgi:hypothetical protein